MLSTVTFAGVTFLLFCTFGKPVCASVSIIFFFWKDVQDSMLNFGLSFISSLKKNFTKYVHQFSETHPKLNKSLHFPNWIPWIVFLKRRLHTLWMRLLPFCIATPPNKTSINWIHFRYARKSENPGFDQHLGGRKRTKIARKIRKIPLFRR